MKIMKYILWVNVSLGALSAFAQQTIQSVRGPTPQAIVENIVTVNAPVAPAIRTINQTTNEAARISNNALAPGQKGLRFNFRGVALETVLNYLSDAAGFIIIKETEVKGKIDAWSSEPLTKEEAVNLLNTVLHGNGYAAVQNGRTLTIISRDEAKKRDIPVIKEGNANAIPRTDLMVTQIIPVRYANALQLTKDLLPLLPVSANMTANESANALVITDTQANIRRMALIVNALDTSISAICTIRVLRLQYADAKEVANILKELYPTPSSSGRSGAQGASQDALMARMGGATTSQQSAASTGQSEAKMAASRVNAVADERNNALVVSAPNEIMPSIEELVRQLDENAEDITEFRVFRLINSDPGEMADLLGQLFPDETRSNSGGGRSSITFGGASGSQGGGMNSGTQGSNLAQKRGRVLAVTDLRTSSIIVSAARELFPQISAMIAQLDANPAKKQKVYVYSLENADVSNVETILRGMFEGQSSRNAQTSNNNSQNDQLNNRSQFTQGRNNSSGSRNNSGSSMGGGGGF